MCHFERFRSFILFLLLIPCAILAGCGGKKEASSAPQPPSVQLQSIAIVPANATVNIGSSFQLQAIGKYSDGTSKDITSQVNWNSDSSRIATVAAAGTVQAVGAGTATITAALEKVSERTTVTVPGIASQRIACQVGIGGSFCGPNSPQAADVANIVAALVQSGNGTMCTATPISYDAARDETWLVSAAHCFVDRKDAAQAVAATGFAALGAGDAAQGMPQHGWYAYKGADVDYSRAATGDANAFKIKAVYVPSDYCKGSAVVNGDCPNQNLDNPAKADNDIALVRLAGKFGQPGLYPKLPTPGVYPKLYDQILTAGYGIRAPGVQAPANHLHLHYANTNYGGRSADLPGYHYLFNGNIVGNDNMMFMTCPGDSGGPDLWWDGADWVLISAHATGVGACGQDGNPYLPPQAAPDISTDVGPYKDWINSILAAPSVCGVGNKCACSKNVNPIYSDAALICQ